MNIVRGIQRPASVVAFLFTLFTLSRPFCCDAEWNYDWSQRTDRDGKAAGIYTTTPFPVTESSLSYTIKNDENPTGKKFTIDGTKIVFVDGSIGANCTNYRPSTRACSGGTYHAYTTIAAGIAGTTTGTNSTVLVRDGTYTEMGLYVRTGVDDTHRWMLCGYNQERPIINGVSTTSDTIRFNTHNYATVQRFSIQNNYRDGIFANATVSYGNVIDIELYNSERWDAGNGKIWGDANLIFIGSANMWIFHCTAHRSAVHNFKFANQVTYSKIEWSLAYEAGYWVGFDADQVGNYGANFDIVNDSPDDPTGASGVIIRYNIGHTSMAYGLQLRYLTSPDGVTPGFSVHHNELYDSPHFGDKPGAYAKSIDGCLVIVYGFSNQSWGEIYSNILHDPGNVETGIGYLDFPTVLGIYNIVNTGTKVINVYNNLIYDTNKGSMGARGVAFSHSNTNTILNYFNNSLYFSNDGGYLGYRLPLNVACNPDNCLGFGSGSMANVKNNIFYQGGSGSCVAYAGSGIDHSNNLYFYPKGSRGKNIASEVKWMDGMDPMWTLLPSVAYSWGMGNVSDASPAKNAGVDLESVFCFDFAGNLRPVGRAWTMGILEVKGATQPPTGLRILK